MSDWVEAYMTIAHLRQALALLEAELARLMVQRQSFGADPYPPA